MAVRRRYPRTSANACAGPDAGSARHQGWSGGCGMPILAIAEVRGAQHGLKSESAMCGRLRFGKSFLHGFAALVVAAMCSAF
jgi:hypothetical protein